MLHAKSIGRIAANSKKIDCEGGFSLVEVLVSLVIFAFGVLGMIGLLARATQISYDGEDRMRAALMANEIIAAMWEAGSIAAVTSNSTVMTNWETRVKTASVSGLPNGKGTVSAQDSNGVATVTIAWQPPSRTTGSQYVTKIVIP